MRRNKLKRAVTLAGPSKDLGTTAASLLRMLRTGDQSAEPVAVMCPRLRAALLLFGRGLWVLQFGVIGAAVGLWLAAVAGVWLALVISAALRSN